MGDDNVRSTIAVTRVYDRQNNATLIERRYRLELCFAGNRSYFSVNSTIPVQCSEWPLASKAAIFFK